MLPDEETFAYCDTSCPATCSKAIGDLERYLESEGPYDGVMAFSMGAAFILLWMARKMREKNSNKAFVLPFKVGIFFSVAGPLRDFDFETEKEIIPLDHISNTCLVKIPTVHVWGTEDREKENAEMAIQLCEENSRSVFVHARGHEVPMSQNYVIAITKLIKRAMEQSLSRVDLYIK